MMQETLYHCYSDNCCAFCRLHQCGVTVKQMRKKECLQKQCHHLQKKEEHPYWDQRARMKQRRKDRKLRLA